jgi:hypothetical protein
MISAKPGLVGAASRPWIARANNPFGLTVVAIPEKLDADTKTI